MELKDLSKPLTVDQIEFRVQSINNGGYATILAYKDARADMQRLNDVCGPLGWKREHSRDNKNCIVSIYDDKNSQWVGKEDTGTESNTEAQKGLASDSFKRRCFNRGIGRELYDYPVIQIKLNNNEFYTYEVFDKFKKKDVKKAKATWDLKIKLWRWYSEFTGGKITFLAARDNNLDKSGKGKVRFQWGKIKPKGENK